MTRILLAFFIGLVSSVVLPASAQEPEKRLALVIGNGAYEAGALETTANDAGHGRHFFLPVGGGSQDACAGLLDC